MHLVIKIFLPNGRIVIVKMSYNMTYIYQLMYTKEHTICEVNLFDF